MVEHSSQEEIVNPASLEKATSYVERNVIPAAPGRKCVDGRYGQDQAVGMIARPGGDFGYVMALLTVNQEKGLGLSAQGAFDAVYNGVTRDGKFFMHTDTHADPLTHSEEAHGLIGCGHIGKAAASEYTQAYAVDPTHIAELVGEARMRIAAGEPIEMVNLEGEHQEAGTLLVRGLDRTVRPSDGKDMYFIYDADRDEVFMKELVEMMQIPGLTYEDFKNASDRQLDATLRILAGGKPLFAVDMQHDTPQVSFVQTVQKFEAAA